MKEIDESIAKYEEEYLKYTTFAKKFAELELKRAEEGSLYENLNEMLAILILKEHIELLKKNIEDLKAIKEKTNK